MIYAISIVSLASIVGFLWALRSTLLERTRIENQLLEATSEVQRVAPLDIDVAVNNVTATMIELVERMSKIEGAVRIRGPEPEVHRAANPYIVPSNLLRHGPTVRNEDAETFQPLRSDAVH